METIFVAVFAGLLLLPHVVSLVNSVKRASEGRVSERLLTKWEMALLVVSTAVVLLARFLSDHPS